MNLPPTFNKILTLWKYLKIKLKEKNDNGIYYLHKKNNSKILLIIFSAMSPKNFPRFYNYVKNINNQNIDILYINDIWGYRGSYYLLNKGENYPEQKVETFIKNFINKGRYRTIITAGTSKGGSAAIIYGLKLNAHHILAGACQYHIGDYLNIKEHVKILNGMRGKKSKELIVTYLNQFIPNLINYHKKNNNSLIHIIYSKYEHTYQEHIKDLLHDFKYQDYKIKEIEYKFKFHNDIGKFFLDYFNNSFIPQII